MSQKKDYNFDGLFIDLKVFGKFQILQYALLTSTMTVECCTLLQIVFLGYIPDHQCKSLSDKQLYKYNVTSHDDINYEKCHIHIYRGLNNVTEELSCINGYNYSPETVSSFVTEWNLVCDKDGLAELSQSFLTIGQGIGALVFTFFADKIGRKPIHIGCTLFLMLAAFGSALSPNIWVFSTLRVFSGAFQQGCAIAAYTLILELFPAEKRILVSCLMGIWWGVSVMTLALVAYIMRYTGWRWLCAVFGLPGIISIFEIWYIKESIRWLFAKGKIEKAERVVKCAAKFNGVDFQATWNRFVKSNESAKELDGVDEQTKDLIEKNERKPEEGAKEVVRTQESVLGIWTLMKYSTTRNITLVLMYSWLITSVTYFGLYLTSSNLSGNRYLNFFLTASMELPSILVHYKLFMLYGRKKAVIILISLAAVSLLTVSIIKSIGDSAGINTTSIVLSLIGMMGISGAFGGLWLYTPEIYPTTFRNAGMGVASATARIGSIISPFTRMLAARVVWGPGLVFGAGCFIASSLFFILPETHNKQLPQNLDEMLNFCRKDDKGKEKKRKNKSSKSEEEI